MVVWAVGTNGILITDLLAFLYRLSSPLFRVKMALQSLETVPWRLDLTSIRLDNCRVRVRRLEACAKPGLEHT